MDWTDDHEKFDTSETNDAKDIDRAPRDVVKQSAQSHAFCFNIQLALWYKPLAPKMVNAQVNTMGDSEKSKSNRKNSEREVNLTVFENEDYTLLNISAASDYQWVKTAKNATQTTVLGMTAHCSQLWPS